MVEWGHRIHGFRYASLRYFNAAGATGERGENHSPEEQLIPVLLQTAAGQRKSISIVETDYPTRDKTCIRDYIHVSDLSRAHLLAFDRLGRDREAESLIYNRKTAEGITVREVVETVTRLAKHPIPVQECARSPGHPPVLVASSEKLKLDLGWEPKHSRLEELIAGAWTWRQQHPEGYTR